MKNVLLSGRLTSGRDFPAGVNVPSQAGHILAVSFEASSAEQPFEIKLKMNTKLLSQLTHRPTRLGSPFVPRRPVVAPSLRLRATTANRSLLRWLRAAESAAWQETSPSAEPTAD